MVYILHIYFIQYILILSHLDSVWAVYILPEEVGSRCSVIGLNVIALRSGVEETICIFNPLDSTTAALTWDRDKIRRTGKMGNLVFLEVGRRCKGGPGLLWMYSPFNEALILRENLHM